MRKREAYSPLREMAADQRQEVEAREWSEGLIQMQAIKRGEVWWVSFDPAVGGENRKTRPAVAFATMPPTRDWIGLLLFH